MAPARQVSGRCVAGRQGTHGQCKVAAAVDLFECIFHRSMQKYRVLLRLIANTEPDQLEQCNGARNNLARGATQRWAAAGRCSGRLEMVTEQPQVALV